jgi:prophage tail gpP-like protein
VAKKENLVLMVDGVKWEGWTSAEISRQMDAISSEFALGLVDRWQHGMEAIPLAAGMPCKVYINDDLSIDGYLDRVNFGVDVAQHSISVNGREKAADLVDCSAVHDPSTWKDLNALEISKILAEPFGVEITSEVDLGEPFKTFKLEEGETAFAAIDRLLKQREILALPDGKGGVKFAKLADKSSGTKLKQGENIKNSSSSFDMTDRFSDYIVKGQRPGNDQDYGPACAQVRGDARDESVRRYRPMMVRAENQVSDNDALLRAKWEASTRAARSVTVSVTVAGWRQDDGKLWEINTLVDTDIPYLRISQELLISKVSFSLTMSGGTVTTLELKDKAAFEPEPPSTKPSGGGSGGGKSSGSSGSGEPSGGGGGGDLQQESADKAWSAHKDIKG